MTSCRTPLESFRFQDEDDYKNEIFSILSSARALSPLSLFISLKSRDWK